MPAGLEARTFLDIYQVHNGCLIGSQLLARLAENVLGSGLECSCEVVVAIGVDRVEKQTYTDRKKANLLEMRKQIIYAVIGCWLSSLILTSTALSKPRTCYSAADEVKPGYVKCEVEFLNGSIFSIKDLSSGYTFRIGKDGWIPVSRKNCIRNFESGSTLCLNN